MVGGFRLRWLAVILSVIAGSQLGHTMAYLLRDPGGRCAGDADPVVEVAPGGQAKRTLLTGAPVTR